jgi:hypothetical protein
MEKVDPKEMYYLQFNDLFNRVDRSQSQAARMHHMAVLIRFLIYESDHIEPGQKAVLNRKILEMNAELDEFGPEAAAELRSLFVEALQRWSDSSGPPLFK